MSLILPVEIEQEIRDHAEVSYPHECCGFLIGREREGNRLIGRVIAAGNQRSDSPENRYSIAPEEFLRTELQLRESKQQVMGFYHSHPDCPAEPSRYDVEHAWPWYSYLIDSVFEGSSRELRSWRLENDRSSFSEEEIVLKLRK